MKKLLYVLYASLIIICLLGFAIHLAPPAEHAEPVEPADEHAEDAGHGEDAEHEEHAPFAFEQIPIFSAIFGFIVCALLGLGAKAYGHNVVMKEEDYYDK
ncbi:MAG: hypothetical protein U9N05_01940 [Euryarchaeota archaeon]|nr:hypothetical protein [Euryarchaeota archaeon]